MNFTIEFFRVRSIDELTRDIGSDFGSRRQSRGCKGESEVSLRDAEHATEAGRVAHLGSGGTRVVRLESGGRRGLSPKGEAPRRRVGDAVHVIRVAPGRGSVA